MVAVPARLRNGVLHFQAPFVAPDQEVEVLVVFAEQPAEDLQLIDPPTEGRVSDRFNWRKSLEATKDLVAYNYFRQMPLTFSGYLSRSRS